MQVIFFKGNEPNSFFRLFNAVLYTYSLKYITLSVCALSWYAVVGRDYQLHVRVLDANKHAFHIGDDVRIDIEASEAHLKPLERLTSDLRGRAVAVGAVPVTARLRNTKLSAKGTLLINELVKVIPQHTYLPWIKNSPNYEVGAISQCVLMHLKI